MFVALVPLFHQLRTSDSKQAWKAGYLFGLVVFLDQMYWLYVLANEWIHRPFLSLLPYVLTAVLEGLFFGWIARLIRHCYIRNWLILIPLAWAGMEVSRSYIPVVALPWGLVATPLYRSPLLIQTAHFGTIYLVTAWVVLLNVILAAVFVPEDRPKMRPLLISFLALLAVSVFQYRVKVPSDPFPMSIGQPGIDMAFGDHDKREYQIAENVDGISEQAYATGSKLLILPEGIGNDSHTPPKPPFAIDKRLPVLFGGQRQKNGLIYQTAFAFDGSWHYADKTRLVIFGEFVPGRSTFPFLAKTFQLADQDLSASTEGIKSVDVAGTTAGPMLCFEALFPEVSYQQAKNGAKFIAVMCIDDWYMGTPAPEQLKAASIFRAVETGLPLARAASLGYSLALDGHGNTLVEAPIGHTVNLRFNLDLPRESTLFPLIFVFPAAALAFAFILPWLPGKKTAQGILESK